MPDAFLHERSDFKARVETAAESEKIDDPALVEKDCWIMPTVFGLKPPATHDGLQTRAGGSGPKRLVGGCNNRKDYDLRMVTDPMYRAEEFIQLFNQVETFLSLVVGPKKYLAFAQHRSEDSCATGLH